MAHDLHFIGTGGAFDFEAGNSAAWVQHGDLQLLVDCGHSVYPRLRQLGRVEQIDAVLLTHLHDDHAGSLSTLLYHRHFLTPGRRLKVYLPTDAFHAEVLAYLHHAMQDATAFADFAPLEQLVGVEAIETTGRHVPGMRSFGFLFHDAQGAPPLAFSGDLGDPDYFFQELTNRQVNPQVVYHDLSFWPGLATHAHYQALAHHANRFNIVGYHHDHRLNPPDNPLALAALAPGRVLTLASVN